MVDAEGVSVKFDVDDRDFKAKWDEIERRLKSMEVRADAASKKAGKGVGGFASAAIGGAAGFIAGQLEATPAVSGVMDLVMSELSVALLPLIVGLEPLLQKLGELLSSPAVQGTLGTAGGLLGDFGSYLTDTLSGTVPPPPGKGSGSDEAHQWIIDHSPGAGKPTPTPSPAPSTQSGVTWDMWPSAPSPTNSPQSGVTMDILPPATQTSHDALYGADVHGGNG